IIDNVTDIFKDKVTDEKVNSTINSIVHYLGGWNIQKVPYAVQIFYQSVYGEIFAKLAPEYKTDFTSRILESEPKWIEIDKKVKVGI
ncbi:MAG: hypothetical protein Q8934_19125, partial [Bacillota bacterium]|nr:hypothetical protein [Bacillota bacterium]